MLKLTGSKAFFLSGLTISLLLLSFTGNTQEHDLISFLKSKLSNYSADFHSERTYVLTDRYLYRPGEIIWFQGFVTSKPNDPGNSYSNDFYVKLLNYNGEEMAFRRYPIVDNMISGSLSLPRRLIPGKYYIVAFTSWMKNQPVNQVFRKEILISKYFDKRLKVEVLFDKLSYLSGDTLSAVITITDYEGKPFAGSVFEYSIETFRKELQKGTAETDMYGKGIISCMIPETNEVILLTVRMKRRKNMGYYAVYIPVVSLSPEIAFFPESGQLVRNLNSKVIFRITDQHGLPMIIEGEIIDRYGNIMHTVSSNVHGLGSFSYVPSGDSTFLKIISPKGINKLYPLPADHKTGMVLNLIQSDQDSATLFLRASHRLTDSFHLTGVMKRQIVWSKTIHFSGSSKFSIPIRDLDAGILQLSVFNSKNNVVAERLISVNDNSTDLVIQANKKVYSNRQRVTLSLEYKGPSDYADIAVSVSPEQMAAHTNMLDFNQVLRNPLCRDTSGTVIFYDNQLTDLELLTSHCRLIDWDRVLDYPDPVKLYYNQDGITGEVVDKKDHPSQLAKVRITSIPSYKSYETQTDDQGKFRILFGADIIDFDYLNVEAYDATGKNSLNPSIDYEYSTKLKEIFSIKSQEMQNYEKINDIISYGDPDLIYALRYGSGRFRRTASIMHKKYDPYQYRDYSDVLDIIMDIRKYDLIENKIVFRDIDENFQKNINQQSALIVVNGSLWGDQVDVLNSISSSDVTNLVISSSPSDIHRYTPVDFPAVIEITTIQGMYRYRKRPVQFLKDLINTEYEFYTPDYSFESLSTTDNRKTLYWNTHIRVERGIPALVSFYTSDIKSIFLSRAEGLDADGNPVSAEFRFSVVGE